MRRVLLVIAIGISMVVSAQYQYGVQPVQTDPFFQQRQQQYWLSQQRMMPQWQMHQHSMYCGCRQQMYFQNNMPWMGTPPFNGYPMQQWNGWNPTFQQPTFLGTLFGNLLGQPQMIQQYQQQQYYQYYQQGYPYQQFQQPYSGQPFFQQPYIPRVPPAYF